MSVMRDFIAKLADGAPLRFDEAKQAFEIIMSGEATPSQIGAFLMALRVRGETVEELTAGATVMREKVLRVAAPANAIDIVGTGGDGVGTYNITTAAMFVVAGCGVPIAKHGNRKASSKSGSADVQTALGINIELEPDQISHCIEDTGVGFMLAPRHHGAMRHVMPSRVELGVRTIFNLLGPLSNPALVNRQLVGVFDAAWVEPLALVFRNLGLEKVWVVYGDGIDEVTTCGPTHVSELADGTVRSFIVTPEDAGLPRAKLEALRGGKPQQNAAALKAVLAGEPGPYRDVVLMNAAAALIVAGKANDLRAGVEMAAASIAEGRAQAVLDKLVTLSNRIA